MNRRDFLRGSVTFTAISLFPSRGDFLAINENFEMAAERTGLDLEMINCGEAPYDKTGDSIRDACLKINRNFDKLAKAL